MGFNVSGAGTGAAFMLFGGLGVVCVTLLGLAYSIGRTQGRRLGHQSGRAAGRSELSLELMPELARCEAELRGARHNRDVAVHNERRLRVENAELSDRLHASEKEVEKQTVRISEMANSFRERLLERTTHLENMQTQMRATFQAAAAEALHRNNAGFVNLAQEKFGNLQEGAAAALDKKHQAISDLLEPVRESLGRVDTHLHQVEKDRASAFSALATQMRGLALGQEKLGFETSNLVKALRAPAARGRWGEIQLRRVVEMAGMVEHCDFNEQSTLQDETGRVLRPDLLVNLPEGRSVVVDAKVPLEAYLSAVEAEREEDRRQHLRRHAGQVQAHIEKLGAKNYWRALADTPEFVVLFLPSDAFLGAALSQRPELLEIGIASKVLVATPTTLIALLHTVHYGWRQEKLAANAEMISQEGRTLHGRLLTLLEHWGKLGNALEKATEQFNKSLACVERRVVPSVRNLEKLGVGNGSGGAEAALGKSSAGGGPRGAVPATAPIADWPGAPSSKVLAELKAGKDDGPGLSPQGPAHGADEAPVLGNS